MDSHKATSPYKPMEDSKYEADGLRTVAFIGVMLSTMATLFTVLAVPMIYSHLQHMQSGMQNEVEFCKMRSANVLHEITRTQVSIVQYIYVVPLTFFMKIL